MASTCDAAIQPVNTDEAARLQPTTHRLLHKHHRLFSAADKSADDPSAPHVSGRQTAERAELPAADIA